MGTEIVTGGNAGMVPDDSKIVIQLSRKKLLGL